MSDFGQETAQWLASLKLGRSTSFLTDFKNGYNFGLILQKLHLSNNRQFKNSSDLACVFQNFKNTRDLLQEQFGVQFPLDNIMYKCEQLLEVLRECCVRHSEQERQRCLQESVLQMQPRRPSSLQLTMEEKHMRKKEQNIRDTLLDPSVLLPPKLQRIEKQLEKYRQEKVRHELQALEQRKREIEDHHAAIDTHRQYELTKIKTMHEKSRNLQDKVRHVCEKTDHIKLDRILFYETLDRHMHMKQERGKQELRKTQEDAVRNGLQDFKLNCLRQGIELEADPTRVQRGEEQFNAVIMMERIKDKMEEKVNEHKERIKRENRKIVESKEAGLRAQAIWGENELIAQLITKTANHYHRCDEMYRNRLAEQSVAKTIREKYSVKKSIELAVADESNREDDYRRRRIVFYEAEAKRLEAELQYKRLLARDAISALISITIDNQDTFEEKGGYSYSEWKAIQQSFIDYKEHKGVKTIAEKTAPLSQCSMDYIKSRGEWAIERHPWEFGVYVSRLIDVVEPALLPPPPLDMPLHMAIKIAFVGPSLAGKTVLSERIATHFNLVMINPKTIIREAVESTKEQPEDPKKKKEAKKPEEESVEKIQLRKFGQEVNASKGDMLIEAIEFKLKAVFGEHRDREGVVKEYEESQKNEAQRYARAVKEYEEAVKKKKDSKKEDQGPVMKKYFYSNGFVVDTEETMLEKIQRKFKGYVPVCELKNKKAEELKNKLKNIIPMPQERQDTTLKRAVFDFVVQLAVNQDNLQARNQNKQPLKPIDLLRIKQFYLPFGQPLTNTPTYRCLQNNTTPQQCLKHIIRLIQDILDAKYADIERSKSPTEQPKQISSPQQSPVPHHHAKETLFQIQSLYSLFSQKVEKCFSSLDTIRSQFIDYIMSTQQGFLTMMLRPNDKTGHILAFQESYNSFCHEQTSLPKGASATSQLLDRLSTLYDSLWQSLEIKKNQTTQFRTKFITNEGVQLHIRKLIFAVKALLEVEVNYAADLLIIVMGVVMGAQISKGEKIQLMEHKINAISGMESPLLMAYEKQVLEIVNNMGRWLESRREKSMRMSNNSSNTNSDNTNSSNTLLSDTVERQLSKSRSNIEKIVRMCAERVREYVLVSSVLGNKMDDWIINGLKLENDVVYGIYKGLKQCIVSNKPSSVHSVRGKDITEYYAPLQYPTRIIAFTDASLMTCCLELKCLVVNHRIPYSTFQAYWEKRVKSKLLSEDILRLNYDTMQQYLVTDESCSYYELMLALVLRHVSVMEQEESGEFRRHVGSALSMDYEGFVMPRLKVSEKERREMRDVLYQVFSRRGRVQSQEYMEAWRVFEQLQLIRYGDAVMLRT